MKIPLDKIKPDPNQPRKVINDNSVANLAKTLKTEGLIQPIEVDKNYMIIVGEMRFRAARELGWKEIEVNINTNILTPYERLRRQMVENLQQSGASGGGQPMNAIDTAKAWVRLYELRTTKGYVPGTHPLIEKNTPGGVQKVGAFETIAEEVGVDKHTVWELLKLLEQPKYVIDDLLAGRPRTHYREAERAPEEVKEKIKEKIAAGEYERPEGGGGREAIIRDVKIAKKIPDIRDLHLARKQDKESAEANKVLNAIDILSLALADNPLPKIATREQNIIRGQLEWIVKTIDEYLAT